MDVLFGRFSLVNVMLVDPVGNKEIQQFIETKHGVVDLLTMVGLDV